MRSFQAKNLFAILAVTIAVVAAAHADDSAQNAILAETGAFSPPAEQGTVPLTIRTEPTNEQLSQLNGISYDAPDAAGLILVFRAPSTFSTDTCGANKISASDTTANSVVWPQDLGLVNGSGSRTQEVKGLGDTMDFQFQHGDCNSSITVGARLYELMGGPGAHLVGYLADDNTIEAFHTWQGFNDPYGRKLLGMNALIVHLRDPEGRELNVTNTSYFILPLKLKYDRYLQLAQSARNSTVLDVGGQALLPLDSTFDQAATGAFANLVNVHRLVSRLFSTLAFGIGTNIQKNVFGGYNPSDSRFGVTSNAAIAAGLTWMDKSGEASTSILLSAQTQTPLLHGHNYRLDTYDPDYEERETAEAQTSNETGFVLSLSRNYKRTSFSLYVKEDYKSPQWSDDGNNNEDFMAGFKVEHKLK